MTKAAMIYALIVTALLLLTVIIMSFVLNHKDKEYEKIIQEIREENEQRFKELQAKEEKKDKIKVEYDKKKESANTGNRADDVAATVDELQKLSGKRRQSSN